MRSSAVQFRGAAQVVSAYLANDMPAWSVWSSPRDLMFAYEGSDMEEGADMLREVIDRLRKGGSEAAYNLKVYDGLKKGTKITSGTQYSRSFSFGVYELDGDDTPYAKRQLGVMGAIEQRFQAMQDELMKRVLKKLDDDDRPEEPEKVGGLAGMLNGLLDAPGVKEAIVSKVMGLVSGFMPSRPAPAQVAGVEGELPKVSADQYDKLTEAVNILAKCDPQIGDHLLALALIARDNPKKYQMALTFL